jgi:hypothetical protein
MSAARLPKILTLTIAASLACSLPGGLLPVSPEGTPIDTSEPTASPSPESGGDTLPPETVLDRDDIPPSDLYEGILAGVETGKWTFEEGLLAVLRSLAGQTGDPFEQGELGGREATAVIREARRYLRVGEDPTVKAEIEELLAIIVPPIDRIREYSRPEQEAGGGGGGMAAPARADPMCEEIAAKGFPPGENIVCYLIAQAPMGGEGVEVFYPADVLTIPTSTTKIYADAALAAVLDSWNTYKSFGTMGSVAVVFGILQNGASTLAEVPSASGPVPCVILIYPLSLIEFTPGAPGAGGIGGFKQIVAHEMFHCFQGWNYPGPFDNWALHRWWGEGSADYFSNLVYPTVNFEWGRFPSFVVRSASESIFQMAYENTLFFQFLEHKIQPQGLISLFHLFGGTDTWDVQQGTLSGVAGMSDYWHEFGRAVVDQDLVDTSGAQISKAYLPQYWTENVAITATQPYDLPGRDFALPRYEVALGGGLGYHVHVAQTDVEILHAARTLTGPPWAPVAIDRDSGCARYAVLVTSAGSSTETRPFTVEAVVDQPTEGGVCDTCVLGRWRMTHESYQNLYQTITQEAEGLPVSSMLTVGDLEMEVLSDGTLLAEAMPFTVQTMGGIPDLQGDPIYTEITVQFAGSSQLQYLAMAGEFLMTVVAPGITTTSQVNLGGQVFDGLLEGMDGGFDVLGSGPPGAQYYFTYQCSATELELTSPDPIYQGQPWVFKKVPQP